MLALIKAFGYQQADVIGHDWGAVAAYMAANQQPETIRRMVTAAVPHPRAIRPWPGQLRKFWYMGFFQLRGLSDMVTQRNDFAFIERRYRDWSPGWAFSPADLQPVKEALSAEGSLKAALSYYRAMAAALLGGQGVSALKVAFAKTAVPTLTIAGNDDGCMGPDQFASSATGFSGEHQVQAMPGCGHFMHREQPEHFAQLALTWLQ